MSRTLLWRLLAINLVIVGVAVAVAAFHLSTLANGIFMRLMKEFHIEVAGLHTAFLGDLRRALVQVSVIAGLIGLLLSVVMFRAFVRPIRAATRMAQRIAAGDYAARAPLTSADELGDLVASLNTMAESLETLERLRKDLVANVAHELRTPLSNLRGYLEAVRDGVTPASFETITLLHDEVMRLVRLVQALHDLSRFDANLPHVRPEPVDPAALVRRVLELRRPEFEAKGIALGAEGGGAGPIVGDADLLTQALHNLLDNALAYTPAGGRVAVSVAPDAGGVRFGVANTGPPIPPEDLPFVFERFYRGDRSRARSSGGAGIGLAIVKEVARLHGGDVGAASAGGETTVWLTVAALGRGPLQPVT